MKLTKLQTLIVSILLATVPTKPILILTILVHGVFVGISS